MLFFIFHYRLKDIVAGYKKAPGKHGSKETSTTNYKQYLEKNFVSVHGQATPKWAQLTDDGSKKKADALENLTKVRFFFMSVEINNFFNNF